MGLLIASGLALVAFGPRPDANLPKDRVVISYWEKWTGREAEQMKAIVDDFNRSVGREKGIFVQYLSITQVDRKTLTSTAAGVPPDVAGLWDSNVVPFAAADALEPLDELAAEYGIKREDYKPVYWELSCYDGKLVSLPSTPSCVALHYKKSIFYEEADALRAARLDPTRPPRSLSELDRYALALDTHYPDGRIDRTGYLPMEPGWWITSTGIWFGGTNYDRSAKRFTLTAPHNLAAFEWVAGYSKRMGPKSMTEFRSAFGNFASPNNPFFTDDVVMIQQGPWMANYILEHAPHLSQELVPPELEMFLPRVVRPFNYRWEAAPFPSAVPGAEDVTYCAQDVLMIPRGARHKREAFEFIAYVQRQEVMEKLCASHCKNSPLAKVSDNFILTHPNPYIAEFERMSSGLNANMLPRVPIGPEMTDELNVMSQRIYLLEETPAEALRKAQARLQQKLDVNLERKARRQAAAN